jgi:hypothetical protein
VGNDHCPGVYRPVFLFFADWFPIYLVAEGISPKNGLIAVWTPFIAADLGNFFGGGMSRYLIKRGCPVGAARIALVIFGGIGITLPMPTVYRQSVDYDATVQTRNILLRVVHDDRQRAALRPFGQRVPSPP